MYGFLVFLEFYTTQSYQFIYEKEIWMVVNIITAIIFFIKKTISKKNNFSLSPAQDLEKSGQKFDIKILIFTQNLYPNFALDKK